MTAELTTDTAPVAAVDVARDIPAVAPREQRRAIEVAAFLACVTVGLVTLMAVLAVIGGWL